MVKNILEELNFIQTGDYTNEEFEKKFRIKANSNIWKLTLDKTFFLSKILNVEHSDLIVNLTKRK